MFCNTRQARGEDTGEGSGEVAGDGRNESPRGEAGSPLTGSSHVKRRHTSPDSEGEGGNSSTCCAEKIVRKRGIISSAGLMRQGVKISSPLMGLQSPRIGDWDIDMGLIGQSQGHGMLLSGDTECCSAWTVTLRAQGHGMLLCEDKLLTWSRPGVDAGDGMSEVE